MSMKSTISDQQFGFRRQHGTPEQILPLVKEVTNDFENKEFWSAVFLDIQQAFDRVWHKDLLYKCQKISTPSLFRIT